MNFLSTALSLVLSLALRDPRSSFVAGQDCGEDDKCGYCKKEFCPDKRERRRCKRDHCSLEELVALFPGDLIPEPSALDRLHKVQKGSEVKQLRVGAAAEKKKKKGGKKGGKKGRSPDGPAFGPASLAENTYTTVLTFGPNLGLILGAFTYDETGMNFVGGSRANFPNSQDPTARLAFPVQFTGIVSELDAQGTGQQTVFLDFGDLAGEAENTMSLEVTEVDGTNAETVRAAFLDPSPGIPGALVDATLTRRRADGYTNRSLRGLYAITCNSGTFTGFASGKLTFDGSGGLSGAMTLNDPDPENPIEARKIVATDVTGSYEVEDGGFATVSLTYEADGFESGPSQYLVTTNERSLITGMTGGFSVPSPANGGLVKCELASLGVFSSEDDHETMMQ